MSAKLIAGLDIGSTKTRAVIGEVTGEAPRSAGFEVRGVGQAPTTGLRGDIVTNIEATSEAIRQALREAEGRAGATVDRVFAGIGGDHVEARRSLGVVAVAGDLIETGDLDRVHEAARALAIPTDRELLHAILTDYRVDQQGGIKYPIGMAAARLEAEVCLITAAARAADNLRKAVSKAGYGVHELVLEQLAATRAVLSEDEKEVGTAVINVGGSNTGLAVCLEGRIRHVASFPMGGDAVTADLVKELRLPWSDAQKTKEQYGSAIAVAVDPREMVQLRGAAPGEFRQVAREMIAHVAEQRMEELFALVLQDLRSEGLMDGLRAGVVLTGGGVGLPGILQLAQRVFPAPVCLGDGHQAPDYAADSIEGPAFTTAIGLALYGLDRFTETGHGVTTVTSGLTSRVGAWVREFF
jgi:cell division protein FtsA